MKIYVAIPAMNESAYIVDTIDSIRKQEIDIDFEVFVCVNQPDDWWQVSQSTVHSPLSTVKHDICLDNLRTIDYLRKINDISVTIIDKSSKGKGWEREKACVGWARKTVMDAINAKAHDDDLIISMDADTTFGKRYFQNLTENFKKRPDSVAASLPYYHPLLKEEINNRAILRYEIYLRYYLINLLRINCPYSFTALGSAIALPVSSYRAIKGITPKKSGEDFYFLQKLCKYGKVLIWNEEHVNPSSRYSDRVFFGTGPALIKGKEGNWESYPIYNFKLFDEIEATYLTFAELFEKDIETPMSEFLKEQFKNDDLWTALRKNNKDTKGFIRACHTKIDGLRILQYLKSSCNQAENKDEINLKNFLNKFFSKQLKEKGINISNISFTDSSVGELDKIRDFIFYIEMGLRKETFYTGM